MPQLIYEARETAARTALAALEEELQELTAGEEERRAAVASAAAELRKARDADDRARTEHGAARNRINSLHGLKELAALELARYENTGNQPKGRSSVRGTHYQFLRSRLLPYARGIATPTLAKRSKTVKGSDVIDRLSKRGGPWLNPSAGPHLLVASIYEQAGTGFRLQPAAASTLFSISEKRQKRDDDQRQ